MGVLQSLKYLDISNNKLKDLPTSMRLLNLTKCNLENNPSESFFLKNILSDDWIEIRIKLGKMEHYLPELLKKIDKNECLTTFDIEHPLLVKYAILIDNYCKLIENNTSHNLLAILRNKETTHHTALTLLFFNFKPTHGRSVKTLCKLIYAIRRQI